MYWSELWHKCSVVCVGTLVTNNLQQSFPSCNVQTSYIYLPFYPMQHFIYTYFRYRYSEWLQKLHLQFKGTPIIITWTCINAVNGNVTVFCSLSDYDYDHSPNPPTPIMYCLQNILFYLVFVLLFNYLFFRPYTFAITSFLFYFLSFSLNKLLNKDYLNIISTSCNTWEVDYLSGIKSCSIFEIKFCSFFKIFIKLKHGYFHWNRKS